MKLASFDIFDTTLIRKCGRPENIFYLLSYRLYPEDIAKREAFLLWRCNAEKKAICRNSGCDEIGLKQIYADRDLSGFKEYTPDQMLALECLVESENLIVNPSIRNIILRQRQQGFQICFISDMYLDGIFLRSILEREKCIEDGESIYISCECNARKSNGGLFDHVKNILSPDVWIHYGDNLISDVRIPRKKGIKAIKIDTDFTPAEKIFIQDKNLCMRDNFQVSILTGISRAARIVENNDPINIIAADFIAPAYIPYIFFIFDQAVKKGIKQLYFLSRDSYILMKAAQQIHSEYEDIELRYLFVSRRSLMLPYLTDFSREVYLEAIEKGSLHSKKVNSLLQQLGVDIVYLKEVFNITFSYDIIRTKEQEEDFLTKIFDSQFTPEIKKLAKTSNLLFLDYLSQEGLLNGKKSAMIDVGWLGTSRLMINSILRQVGQDEVEFFYFGIREDVLPIKYGSYQTFYSVNPMLTGATALVENYFSASPYPTVVGYERINDKVQPKFPVGLKKEDTHITIANVKTLKWMLRTVALYFGTEDRNILFAWSATSLDTIIHLEVPVNLNPLLDVPDFDGIPLVQKLSIKKIFLLSIGKRITAFDKASLALTCGYHIFPIFWSLHIVFKRSKRLFRFSNLTRGAFK